jgi:hypothetical protein
METCLSPRRVFVTAWIFDCCCLLEYFGFHVSDDFLLSPLFVCLVLRTYLKLSYLYAVSLKQAQPRLIKSGLPSGGKFDALAIGTNTPADIDIPKMAVAIVVAKYCAAKLALAKSARR